MLSALDPLRALPNGGMSSIHFRGVHQEVDHRGVVYQVASYDARPAW